MRIGDIEWNGKFSISTSGNSIRNLNSISQDIDKI